MAKICQKIKKIENSLGVFVPRIFFHVKFVDIFFLQMVNKSLMNRFVVFNCYPLGNFRPVHHATSLTFHPLSAY